MDRNHNSGNFGERKPWNGHYTGSTKEQSKIENEERRERYRQILERRKAKAANDQETVQSATKDNTNDISNDGKKAK